MMQSSTPLERQAFRDARDAQDARDVQSGSGQAQKPVLQVIDLEVTYYTDSGRARALDDVSFTLNAGEKLGLVGESGSGKSTMALAMMRMIKPPGRIEGGQVIVGDTDLTALSDEDMRKARLSKIAYIPQGAMNSLNPVMRIGAQMRRRDQGARCPSLSKAEMQERCMQALEVGGLEARASSRCMPHELSGGMKQRVCIAIGILLKPQVIIADEPTSALDVVTQRQVMETIDRVQDQTGRGGHPDRPRHGPDGAVRGQGGGDVRRAADGDQHGARDVHRPEAPLCPGADQQPAQPGKQGRVSGHPRPRALAAAAASRAARSTRAASFDRDLRTSRPH